jgi:hypothetical protein
MSSVTSSGEWPDLRLLFRDYRFQITSKKENTGALTRHEHYKSQNENTGALTRHEHYKSQNFVNLWVSSASMCWGGFHESFGERGQGSGVRVLEPSF